MKITVAQLKQLIREQVEEMKAPLSWVEEKQQNLEENFPEAYALVDEEALTKALKNAHLESGMNGGSLMPEEAKAVLKNMVIKKLGLEPVKYDPGPLDIGGHPMAAAAGYNASKSKR